MNNSLLQINSGVKPVFGRSASWLCLGKRDAMPVKSCERAFEATSLSDVCFLYLLTPGETVRLQCPALDFDLEGEFEEVWAAFDKAALARASELTGHAQDEMAGCVTSAWMGETRAQILNNAAQPINKNPALVATERGNQEKEIF